MKFPRECTKCKVETLNFEGHHIIYRRGMRKVFMCLTCHREITEMNTVAFLILGHKVPDRHRWLIWVVFYGLPKGSFLVATGDDQKIWMRTVLNDLSILRIQPPRGQFTDAPQEQ